VHELIVVDLDPPIPVGVNLLERLRQLLDHDASPNESVEGYTSCLGRMGWSTAESRNARGGGRGSSVFLLDKLKELRGQVISKLFEGGLKLCAVDRTGAVLVEVLEDTLPILDVFPESREFIESDGSTAVGIEYRHQELDSVKIEGSPISVDQGLLKFGDTDVARSVGVDGVEPLPQLRI